MLLGLDQVLAQLDVSATSFRRVESTYDMLRDASAGQAHVIAVLGGQGRIRAGDGVLVATAGELLLLPGSVTPRPAPGLVVVHGLLDARLLDGRSVFDYLRLPHRLDAAGSELLTGAIPELLRESACGGPGSDAIITCLARRLVTTFLRDAWRATDGIPPSSGASRRARLDAIVDLMRKDPGRDYTLEALADTAALSRTAFHRVFVDAYGVTPLAMLRGLRLERARELLRHTDMPVKTITARLGYRSRSHFCKLFREAYGDGPERFRHRHGAADGKRQAA